MDDSEINTLIADIEGRCSTPDYCNMWSDIGPIIEREKIGVYPDSVVWKAFHDDIEGEAESPTKAAALCFLMIKAQ